MNRELTFGVGDSLIVKDLLSEINYNVKRLLNLQLFSVVRYQVSLVNKNEIDIQFQLIEILYWVGKPEVSLADRNFNVWWFENGHDLGRTNIGATVIRHNFRGRNEEIAGTLQLGYNKLFECSYRIPYIDRKLRQGIGFSIQMATGREINYTTDSNKLRFFYRELYPYQRIQAKLHYTYRRAYATTHEFQLGYNKFDITGELLEKNPDYLGGPMRVKFLELNYIFQYNNTDIRIYPLNGLDVKLMVSKKGLGMNTQINRLDLVSQSSLFYKIARDWSASLVFRGRLSFPQQQPYFINRALGFKNEYVRGYEYYVIDGSHYALVRTNLRYKLMDRVWHQNWLKFIKYIPVRVYAKAFDDIGYVHNEFPGNSFLNNRILHGYGAGIDLVLSYYVRFRLEYSFNHLGEKGLFLHSSKE